MKLFAFAAFFGLATAGQVKFQDCGHNEVVKLNVTGCGESDECVIHKGKDITVNCEFITNQDANIIVLDVSATIEGLEIPVPGLNRDGCTYVQCPVEKGKHVNFNYSLNVPKLLPSVHAAIKFKLNGPKGSMACLTLKGAVDD